MKQTTSTAESSRLLSPFMPYERNGRRGRFQSEPGVHALRPCSRRLVALCVVCAVVIGDRKLFLFVRGHTRKSTAWVAPRWIAYQESSSIGAVSCIH